MSIVNRDEEMEALQESALDHLWLPFSQMNQFLEDPDDLTIFVEGEGCWLTDSRGARIFDMMSGMWLKAIGYGRKEIAEAVYQAMQGITYNPWGATSRNTIELSAKLASLAPDKGSRVFLASGGSEANETAVKMAKKYHRIRGDAGRYKVVSRRGSYHGTTHATMTLGGGGVAAHQDYGPLQPGSVHVSQPHSYRCGYCKKSPTCNLECAREVERVIQFEGPETVAAFIGEPMSVAAGVTIPHPDYWPAIRSICDKYGVLLILDEVVTGFGRTGKWFASEHWDLQPDITSVAKALSSGYLPVAATIARKEVADTFLGAEKETFRHLITYGGHPIACAAALANLEIIENESLVEHSERMGRYLFEQLEVLNKHSIVGDIRGGFGLFCGVELVKDRDSKEPFPPEAKVPERLTAVFRRHGLMTRVSNVIPILPPLVISKDEVDHIVREIDASLKELSEEI